MRLCVFWCAVCLAGAVCLDSVNSLQAQPIIVTAAGTDLVFRYAGGTAANAPLGKVSRVTIDPQGRPVFSDPNYNLIFRANPDGTIQVIAGNNVQGLGANVSGIGATTSAGGFSGDFGPATSAALNRPFGVAYDAAGNLYIADTFNNRIRKVDTQGTITTIAGNGQRGSQGDTGPASSASLYAPSDVVVDGSGNIYINDTGNLRIREITPQGTISTAAGNGANGSGKNASGTNVPAASPIDGDIEGLAVDSQGNLYFAEKDNNRVRELSKGVLTTVAGTGVGGFADGPVGQAMLNQPGGVAVDSSSNLYISDTGNQRIRMVSGGIMTTIAGTGQEGFGGDGGAAKNALLHNPFGLAAAASGVYVADRDNARIRKIAQGNISTIAGNGTLISSQNGVTASLATLFDPFGVSVDNTGALVVADTDNNLLRRRNSNGTLSTFAGNGADEISGDNGPAATAGLCGPFSATVDSSGNVYDAEINCGAVRRIGAANGLIGTLAGGAGEAPLQGPSQAVVSSNGTLWIADFAGSGLIQVAASGSFLPPFAVSTPGGLAFDSFGNLYVTEWSAGLVLRISPAGTISTFAGGGKISGVAADGGPAVNAKLGSPAGIIADSAGNVYFSDSTNSNVRKVALNGTISTVAGNGQAAFSGDGGPATSASLRGPWGLAFDSTGSLYIADVGNNRIREVLLNSSPSFSVSSASISLTGSSNGKVTDPTAVTLTSSLPGLLYATSTDQPWLQVTGSSAAMPATLQISADPTGLLPGTYPGNVTITAAGANPAAQTVAVTFTVSAAAPAVLSLDSTSLAVGVSIVAGAAPVTRSITVRNTGSGSLTYSASSSVSTGAGWLTVAAGGTATPNAPGTITVTLTPGQLPSNTYSGAITVTSSAAATPLVIPVTLVVSAPVSTLTLSQSGFTLQAVAGGGVPLARNFTVLNTGLGSMAWSATVSAGANWLAITPSSGTVQTPLTDVSQVVSLNTNTSALKAGTYYGKVDVTAGGSFQSVVVVLTVLPAGSTLAPDVYPTSLIFLGSQGANPGSQTVSIANLTTQAVTYTSSQSTSPNPPWFVHVPTTGVAQPNQPASIVVQPDFTSLAPGSYQGSITFQLGSVTSTVQVLSIVSAATSPSSGARIDALIAASPDAGSACGPLQVSPTTLTGSSNVVQVGQPQTLSVRVVDSCKNLVTSSNGFAQASFSNGYTPVALKYIGNGAWSQDWTPTTSSSSPVTITFSAAEGSGTSALTGSATATVSIPSASTTSIFTAGVNNSASGIGNYISPGGLVSVYGQNLAATTVVSGTLPFPTTVNGTQVFLGGQALPLRYVGNGQINAQVPFGLTPNSQQQLIVQNGNTLSAPQDVLVAPAQPGIYTRDGTGSGLGDIVNGITNVFISATNPAHVGDSIVIYCNGLGAVNPAVPTGTAAPAAGPLSRTVNPVTVTIGGIPAPPVAFAGLTPGYPDLYQVNTVVPAGVTPGNQVAVVVSVAGQSSPSNPPVTLVVQ